MLRLRAGSVHPVTAPPISDGAVLIAGDGRIAAVGPHARVPTPPGAEIREFPDGVLVPGLVNCHTHLELTHLAGRVPTPEFAAWIRRIRELKDGTRLPEFRHAAEQGIRDCWAAGVTCVADTGSTGAVMEVLQALGGRGIVYQEVFGPDPARCEASLAELEAAVERLHPFASDRLRLGVSPHAPYTVSAPLYRAVAAFARRRGLPLAGHGAAPFAAFRAGGIPVGLGTDSVVSTGDVNLWGDALAVGLAGEDALRMLTLEGARVLGLESAIGSIEVGKQADLAVFVGLLSDRPTVRPSDALLTVVAGQVVHRYIGSA